MEVTLQTLDTKLGSLDTKLDTFFGQFRQFAAVTEEAHQEIMEFMRDNLVTHEDLKTSINEAEARIKSELRLDIARSTNQIMNYVDKKDADYKGELISSLRKEDVKVDQTIVELENHEIFSDTESARLQSLGPFRKAPVL
ncbi:MAG: hypothetical protein NT003_01330 [Candidatus Magasanikbacteria bacterium]|nr:hypothetical protein [Candidatus Magasanikbacteria bacterium]